ncbi:MAG: hypothetical protein WC997_08095 [Porticoccaceae bacterium]
MKKATHSEEQGSQRKADHINPADVLASAPNKKTRVLAYLLIPGNSLNRFDAEEIGDHCLPSTISGFTHDHGLILEHRNEKVPNRWGKSCIVTRYRIPEGQRKDALALLAYLVRKAGKPRLKVMP